MDSKVSALPCCVHLGTCQALALPPSGWVSRHLGFLSEARFCLNHSFSIYIFAHFTVLLFFFFTVLLFLPSDQRLSSRKAGASLVLLADKQDGIPGPSLCLTHVGAR